MGYPKGTKFNEWRITEETEKGKKHIRIRRWIMLPDGKTKNERLPIKKYVAIRDKPQELKDLVIRLNNQIPEEQRVKQAVIIKHAFISPELLDQYKEWLNEQIPTRSNAVAEYSYLTKYFLNYFIGTLNLPDPIEWHKVHQTKWSKYLISKECPASVDAKMSIVRSANRFMKWLHKQRPEDCPALFFEPLSRAKRKYLEAEREMKGEKRKRGYITDDHWKLIVKNLPDFLRPFAILAYKFGLRRAETLGLKLSDVRNGFLSIERQLDTWTNGKPGYKPLKDREKRKVPYWHSSAKEAFNLISEAQKFMCHPDTLTDEWAEFLKIPMLLEDKKTKIILDYDFHDLRHTWVTRSLNGRDFREVQLAAGHESIETTMKYAHDDRTIEDLPFDPNSEAS